MKMKKVFASVLTAVLSLTVLSGCGGDHSAGSADGAVSGEGSYKIGISQFAEHPSLDNCRKGFLAGLKEEGIAEGKNLEVLYDKAQSDTSVPTTIASSYISQNVDLTCAIATPSAAAAYNAAKRHRHSGGLHRHFRSCGSRTRHRRRKKCRKYHRFLG